MQEDASQKALGSNLGAGKIMFSCKITVKVHFYYHLAVEFAPCISVYSSVLIVSGVLWSYVPRIQKDNTGEEAMCRRYVTISSFAPNATDLNMAVVEILVGLRPDVLDDVADTQHQLVLDRRNPGVVVQLQDGARAQEVLEHVQTKIKTQNNFQSDLRLPCLLKRPRIFTSHC